MRLLDRLMVVTLATGVIAVYGDTIQLRNGQRVEGTFLGGDTRQVKLMDADGNLQNFGISDVESITFKGSAATTAAPAATLAPPTAGTRTPAPAAAAPPAAAPYAARVTVPAGTVLTVRMIDGIDSDVAKTGERFRGSLDVPLQIGDQTIAPRGTDVTVQLVRVEQSGKLTGRDEIAMDLYDITINGRSYPVATNYAEVQSASRGARSAKVVGGGAALGAIIGAVAGGGSGAAIGAASGAGAGTAVQVLTKGQKVKIPSESRLDFSLKQPLSID